VRRGLLLAAAIVLVAAGAIAGINRAVDPKDEFYSGAALTKALDSRCLLADDLVRRRYPEFKQDLFDRRRATRILLAEDVARRRTGPRFVHMGFPGLGPEPLLDEVRAMADGMPNDANVVVRIVTDVSWFDEERTLPSFRQTTGSKIRYLLSPRTLSSSLGLIRRSRTLAFTGWQQEQVGRRCVVDRGTPTPAWHADGTLAGKAPQQRDAADGPSGFAFTRLTPLDEALAVARANGWRVVGYSGPRRPTPLWEAYQRELSALFARHGYKWRIRRMAP
jgi:hypothetical protein